MSMLVCGSMSNQPGGNSWYALYTRHQHEKVVDRILRGKSFETFLPVYKAVHRWKDRSKELLLPLFPCYVFLRGHLDRRIEMLSTPGVCGLVGSEGRASAIPEEEIESVRVAVSSSFRIEPHPFLNSGDWIRVTSGPLEGTEGILVRKKNAFRLVLSVEILGTSAAVEIDGATVEKVASKSVALLGRERGDLSTYSLGCP